MKRTLTVLQVSIFVLQIGYVGCTEYQEGGAPTESQNTRPTTESYQCPMKCDGEKVFSTPGKCTTCTMNFMVIEEG